MRLFAVTVAGIKLNGVDIKSVANLQVLVMIIAEAPGMNSHFLCLLHIFHRHPTSSKQISVIFLATEGVKGHPRCVVSGLKLVQTPVTETLHSQGAPGHLAQRPEPGAATGAGVDPVLPHLDVVVFVVNSNLLWSVTKELRIRLVETVSNTLIRY